MTRPPILRLRSGRAHMVELWFWRGRMGVEPTGAGITDAHAVLKTGEATGPLPPPLRVSFDTG